MTDPSSEFKLFKLIEDTIEGVIVFVDHAFKTAFVLVLFPHRFSRRWMNESNRRSFLRPFTFLALVIVALSLAAIVMARARLGPDYPLSETGNVPTEIAQYFTLSRVFMYSIPPILLIAWLSRVLAQFLASSPEDRTDSQDLACYACTLQCLFLIPLLWTHAHTAQLVQSIGLVCAAYAVIGPVIVLGTATKGEGSGSWFKRLIGPAMFSLVSFGAIMLCAATYAAVDFLKVVDSHEKRMAEIEGMVQKVTADVLSEKTLCAVRDVRLSADGRLLSFSALLTNQADRIILQFGRTSFEIVIAGIDGHTPVAVRSWPVSGPVLLIEPRQTICIELEAAASESLTQADRGENHAVAFTLLADYFERDIAPDAESNGWRRKAVEFGKYEFRFLKNGVDPPLKTIESKSLGESVATF